MNFLIVLLITIVVVALIAKPLKKWPWLFYVVAVLLNALYIASVYSTFVWPALLKSALYLLMQRCTLALALFVVVMFIGVFSKESKVSLLLRPVRAELSIMACILTMGHMAVYLIAFAPRLLRFSSIDAGFLLFMASAFILLVLLLILGITSFKKIRLMMSATAWKKVQKFAYVFFGLIYVHLVSILLAPALAGAQIAQISIVIYTVLFLLYAVLRLRRWQRDKKESALLAD